MIWLAQINDTPERIQSSEVSEPLAAEISEPAAARSSLGCQPVLVLLGLLVVVLLNLAA
jgi:hypothetical protein